jgi:hypothetical protein
VCQSSRPLARLPIVKCVGEPLSRRRSGAHLSASRSPIARRSGWSRGRGSPQPYRRRQRVSSSILMFSAGVEPPHPGGLSWSGPGVPAGPAKPTIIHLLETTNEGRLGNSGSFGSLTSRVKAQPGTCAGTRLGDCCRARTTQWMTPMRKFRSFAAGSANRSSRPRAVIAGGAKINTSGPAIFVRKVGAFERRRAPCGVALLWVARNVICGACMGTTGVAEWLKAAD